MATVNTSRNGPEAESVRENVREGYSQIARAGVFQTLPQTEGNAAGACCGGEAARAGGAGGGGGGCCGGPAVDAARLATAIGYAKEEIEALPEGANMGLSCGNPGAIAALRPGEVVLDLGSGGGFDAFLCGPKVGPTGRVIGVDMTPDMLSKARRNLVQYRQRTRLDNVEFRLGEIENLPIADASVDVVISNCVINLSPDKPRVYREIARVLKPGGRVAISDLALLRPLPDEVMSMVAALVGCVSGASPVAEVEAMARDAGLVDIRLESKTEYIDAMTDWRDPLYRTIVEKLPPGAKASDYITSLDLTARKPA